ncbi:MAG: HPr family phosphocarrier protein [Eubacteriales bacterium]
MKEYQCTITAENGMHARPAGMLASRLGKYLSDVKVSVGNKQADGKRLIALMSLGAVKGTVLTFHIIGTDEEQVLNEIKDFCQERLMSDHTESNQPQNDR